MMNKEIEITFEDHVKKVEKQMGMSLDDFHTRLNELLTPEYLQQAQDNFAFLKQWLADGKPIVTVKKKGRMELELQEGEYFVPCFDPGKPVRNELPVIWFYSNKDNLVSIIDHHVSGGKRVYWLPPKVEEDGSGRGCQKWQHPVTGQIKTIKAYQLGALIFNDGNVFGNAKNMLELFGSYSYGNSGDPFYVQGHHMESKKNAPDRIYDHDNIQTLDAQAHDLLRKIKNARKRMRRCDSDSDRLRVEVELLHSIPPVLSKEVPGKITMIMAGDRYNLDGSYKDSKGGYCYKVLAGDESPLSEEQQEYIRNLSQSIQTMLDMD